MESPDKMSEIERLYSVIKVQEEAISNLYYKLESVSKRQASTLSSVTADVAPMMFHISDAINKVNMNTDAINSMAQDLVI